MLHKAHPTVVLVALFVGLLPLESQATIEASTINAAITPSTVNQAECESARISLDSADWSILPGQTDGSSGYVLEYGDSCSDSEPGPYMPCVPGQADCCAALEQATFPPALDPLSSQEVMLHGELLLTEAIDCFNDPKNPLTFYVKVQSLDDNGTNQWTVVSLDLQVDLDRPEPPAGVMTVPGETSVRVSWTEVVSETVSGYKACVFQGDYDAGQVISGQDLQDMHCSTRGSETEAVVTGLQFGSEGIDYLAVVSSFDASDNESLPSEPVSFRTQSVQDFWELYQEGEQAGIYSDGPEEGGYCTTAPFRSGPGAGWLWLLAGGLVLGLRRRSAWCRGGWGLLVCASLLLPSLAAAESPRFMTFELRSGSWSPNVDGRLADRPESAADLGLSTKTPYADFFGNEAIDVLGIEASAHLYQGYGTVAVGGGIGKGSVTAQGLNADGTRAEETSTFSIIPISVFVSYAFDWPAQEWNFPLVPFIKGGLDWFAWSVSGVDGEVSTYTRDDGTILEAAGGVWGWHAAAGVRLLLDSLSPEMATTFDRDMGVNNSYLSVEYVTAVVDDFGGPSIRLGDEGTFFFGLVFDF